MTNTELIIQNWCRFFFFTQFLVTKSNICYRQRGTEPSSTQCQTAYLKFLIVVQWLPFAKKTTCHSHLKNWDIMKNLPRVDFPRGFLTSSNFIIGSNKSQDLKEVGWLANTIKALIKNSVGRKTENEESSDKLICHTCLWPAILIKPAGVWNSAVKRPDGDARKSL